MAINITNKEADSLARQLAKIESTTLTEAIVTALREAIAQRRRRETPQQTAARLRAEFGIDVGRHDVSGMPIPQGRAFDIGAIEAPGEMERRGAASQGKRPETRANPTNGRR